MEKIRVTPRPGKSFMKGVANAKSLKGTFNGALKVWELRADLIDSWRGTSYTRAEYLSNRHLILVENGPANAATTWQGQASMDAEDSIF